MHVLIDYNAKCSLSGLNFQYFNSDDIHKLSVKEITKPHALDKLLNPVQNGLYDLSLGPLDKNDICLTCHLDYFQCPGHFGHIDLALPVYNPVFFKELIKLLRSSCLSCHRFLTNSLEKVFFNTQMTIIGQGLVEQLPLVEDLYAKIVNNNDPRLIDNISFRKDFEDLVSFILKSEQHVIDKSRELDDSMTCNRNVFKSKIAVLKDFMDHKLKANRQTCPNCSLPLRQLRAEHNSKLFYAKGISARTLKKNKNATKLNPKSELTISDELEQRTDDLVDEIDKLDIQLDVEGEAISLEGSKQKSKLIEDDLMNEDEKIDNLTGQTYLTPIETRKHLQKLFENEKEIIGYLLGKTDQTDESADKCELFFFDSLLVPPSKYRPISQFKEQRFENPQTAQLSKCLQQNLILKETLIEIINLANISSNGDQTQPQPPQPPTTDTDLTTLLNTAAKIAKKAPSLQEKLQGAWLQLQQMVNILYDSDLDKLNVDAPSGLKQLLEKKEGLFRKHMMGKRVNYAGRSVISPDVYIGIDEIGIPEIFAKKLTYPQPVNATNFWEMKQLVLNGPDQYPGASLVEYGNGNIVRLKGKDYESRLAIAKQLLTPESSIDSNLDIKIVHRHLKNGDVLLFNRQPTLHRPSVMAHKARVLPNEKTLRMHYSNCKAYNADFDGDEMNAHLPQNEIARAEALNLMLSTEHYLVPKDGTPLGGLIHDHVVSGVALSIRDRFFNKADYQSLVYNSFNSIRGTIKLLPPAILKPSVLWTGKQVISTLLINLLPAEKGALNLEGKAKISHKSWFVSRRPRDPNWESGSFSSEFMNESYVLIRSGNLLSGVLDKAHYGSSSFSLVHCCYELYGGSIAGQLLTSLGRLFTSFLQLRGFTLGVEDILLKDHLQKPMAKIIKRARKCGYEVLSKAFKSIDPDDKEALQKQYQKTHLNPDETYMKEIDLAYKGSVDSFQNSLTNICFPDGLIKQFPNNNLQLMIQSGAKGSSVNSMQMSCLLGQQELEGRRPRLMANGNTLPSFLPYDPSPISGGFICNSFMTGLTPQEYFFHCMAGREGLVDTAVKTSRSGYLQRCLIKHLEGIVVNYDLTVRDSDNCVIQFQYGEDSLAVDKIPFLNEKQFPFLIDNSSILTSNKSEIEKIKKICYDDAIYKKIEKIKDWKSEYEKELLNKQDDCYEDYDSFSNGIGMRWGPFLNFSKLLSSQKSVQDKPFEARVQYIGDQWKSMSKEEKRVYKKGKFKRRLPITVFHNPDRYLGAISEKLQECVDNYMDKYHTKFTDDKLYSNQTSLSYNLNKDEFKELIYLKSIRSCITPGDSVGILAAQSIGEPSTQMTLNTFHFAGRGDMNVTLGIPRLREILMVASSNIKTPSMQIPVFEKQIDKAESLKSHFTRTLLWDCLHKVEIEQKLELDFEMTKKRIWLTKVKFEFLPQDELRRKLNTPIKLYELMVFLETKFIKNLCISINKKYNQISSSSLLHASTVRDKSMKNLKNINQDGAENEDDAVEDREMANDVLDAGESMGEKLLNKINDELEYEGEEQEKDEINGKESDEEEENGDDEENENENENENDDEEIGKSMRKEDLAEKEEKSQIKSIRKKSKSVDNHRVNRILNISDLIYDYSYDAQNLQWSQVTFKVYPI